MAVTVDDLRLQTRAGDSQKETAILTRLLAAAQSKVTRYAPEAPDDDADLATLVYGSYLYDRLPAARGGSYARAFVFSGAADILEEFHEIGAMIVGAE